MNLDPVIHSKVNKKEKNIAYLYTHTHTHTHTPTWIPEKLY